MAQSIWAKDLLPVPDEPFLWLDASDASTLTLEGNAVVQWDDKSGKGNHATQLVPDNQPHILDAAINARPGVDFAADYLNFPDINLVGKTVLAVVQPDDLDDYMQIISHETTNVQLRIDGTTGAIRIAAQNPIYTGNPPSNGTIPAASPSIVAFILNDQMEFSVNGAFEQSGINNDGSGDTTYNRIGARQDLREVMDGKIGEIIVVNSVLAASRQRLEGYLAHKWGLSGNLPNGHPYKAAAPPAWGVTDVLKVDFSQNGTDPLQEGFEGFDPWAPGNSTDNGDPVSLDYNTDAGTNGAMNVKVEGQTHWRDYQALLGGKQADLTDLVRDGALRNANGTMTLTLSGLKTGNYLLTSFHHDTSNGPGVFDATITDANRTDAILASGVSQFPQGTFADEVLTFRTFFTITDGDFAMKLTRTGGGHMSLNGFTLQEVQYSEPPAVTLNGDAHIKHVVGTDFTDPGVTATDPEDGTLGPDQVVVSYLTPPVVPGPIAADTYPGLQLWLKADEGFIPGGWTDQSGAGNDATAHGDPGPELVDNALNGLPVMRYDGDDSDWHSFPTISDIRTVFWVTKRNSGMSFMLGHSGSYHFHSDNNKFWQGGNNTHDNVEFGRLAVNGQTVLGTVTNVPTEMSIISLRTLGDVAANTFSRDRTQSGRNWNGDLAELLIYNTALTDGEIRDIETRLAIKWGFPYSPQSQVVDTFDNNTLGKWEITYTATDSANISRSVMRTVEVYNPEAPVITLVGDRDMHFEQGVDFVDPGYSVADKDGTALDISNAVVKGDVDGHTAGVYFITYDFTDGNGVEAAQVIRTVKVSDSLGPAITLAGGESIKHPLGRPFLDPGYSAVDQKDGATFVHSSQFIQDHILLRGFDDGGTGQDSINFTNNGGVLEEEPDGEVFWTFPLYVTGWNNDASAVANDFNIPGLNFTHKDSNRTVFTGYFRAKVAGEYEFGVARQDDRATFFIDLDQDGLFEQPGDKGNEWINEGFGTTYRAVQLQPGLYKFAAGHYQGGSGQTIEIRFRTPSGAGPDKLTTIDPSKPNQEGLWLAHTQLDTSIPGTHTINYITQDSSGNVSTATRTVEVVKVSSPPVLTLEGPLFILREQYTDFTDPGYIVEDSAGNELDKTGVQVSGLPNTNAAGTYDVTYTFYNDSGVPALPKTRTVVVSDNVAPALELIGDPEVTIVEGEAFEDPGATLVPELETGITVSSNGPIPTKNLWIHLDAGKIEGFAAGDVILNWNDISGNGNDLDDVRGDPILVEKSIGGLPAIRVNGDDFMAATGTEVRNAYSIFTVSKVNAGSNGRLLSSRTRNWLLGFYSNKQDLFHPGGWATPTHIFATQDPHIYSATSSGSEIHFYADGIDRATSNGRNDWLGRFQVGGYNVANEPARGDISEVIIYKDYVSQADEQLHIHTYLASKYGLWGYPQTPAPDLSKPGEHTVTYFARDMAGNVGTVTRKVTVTPDPAKPSITLLGESTMTLEFGAVYEEPGVTVMNGAGEVDENPDLVVTGGVDTSSLGLHTITYDYNDGVAANTVVRTIIVKDTTAPQITLSGGDVIRMKVGEIFADPGATAEDDRTGTVPVFSDLFVPFDGLVLHLDAGSFNGVVADGANIGTWIDQSGKLHHADNRTSDPKWIESGLNSLPVVDFDGNDMVWTSKNFEPDLAHYTILTVARYSADGNQARVFSSRGRNWMFGFHGGSIRRFHSDGWAHNGSGTDKLWHVHAGDVNDSDQANFWLDGVQLAFDNPGLSNTNYKPKVFQIAGHDGNREMSKCQVAEVLLYDRVLPAVERDSITAYLNTKYNLNGGGNFVTRFDLSQPGTHTINYLTWDNLGNKSNAKRTLVVVADETQAYLVLNGDAVDVVEAGSITEYADPGAKALSPDGNDVIVPNLIGQGTVDPSVPGTYTLTYTFGESDPQVRTVIVKDTQGPAIALNGDSPMVVHINALFDDPGGVGTDVLDGDTHVFSDYLPIPDVMDFKQYHLGNSANFLDFRNEGGVLSEVPVYAGHITGGFYGDGIRFLKDNDFRTYTGQNRYDSYQHLASGRFHAKKEGIYEFEAIFNRDFIAIWLDKDQDGKFERPGRLGDERIVWGNTKNTVYLKAGHYRVAFANSAGTGDAQMHIRFRTPEGAGPTTLTTVHPGGPGQEGLWGTWPLQLDTSFPAEYNIEYFSDDAAGNRTTVKRKVIVQEDLQKPVIRLLGDSSTFLHAGAKFVEPGIVLEDYQGNPLDASEVVVTGKPSGKITGTFTVTYEYVDPEDHIADPKVRIVTVKDIVPPEITLIGSDPYRHPLGEPFVDPGALAMDGGDGPVYVSATGSPHAPFALIDIGTNGQRVPDGWTGVGNQNNNTGNRNMGATQITASTGDTFTIAFSNVDWRDRGDSSSADPLAKMAEDFIKHNGGDITFTFAGIPAGDYIFTTYHLDPTFDQCADIWIYVTDAKGSDVRQARSGDASDKIALNDVTSADLLDSSATFPVTSDGSSNVVVRLDGQGADRETPINGIAIYPLVSNPPAGTYEMTYFAVDSHGNSSEATRTVIVGELTDRPEITLVGDAEMTVDVGSLYEDPGIILKDKNGNIIDASLAQMSGEVVTEVPGSYNLGYDYISALGKSATTVFRTVHVADLSPPVIRLVGGSTIRIQLGNRYVEPGFSAEDYLDGDVPAYSSEYGANRMRLTGYTGGENDSILDLNGNGGALNKAPYGVDETFAQSVYTTNNSHWSDNYFPGMGNSNFQVLFDGLFRTTSGGIYEFGIHNPDDRAAFWVDLDGDGVFEINGDRGAELMNPGWQYGYREVSLDPGEHRYAIVSRQGGQGYRIQARYRAIKGVGPASLVDINPSDPLQAGQWILRNPVNVLALGEHKVTYTSVDAAGNVGTKIRTIIVENNPDAAILTLLGDPVMTVPFGGTYIEPGLKIKDLEGNDLPQDKLAVTGTVDTSKLGKTVLEYNYKTDAGIPSRTRSRTVYVVDDASPEITLAGDAEMTVTLGSEFIDPGFSATDNYDGDIIPVGTSQNFPQDGLILHLDASAIQGKADGDPVAIWNDMTPMGHHADVVFGTPTYAASAINGQPAVRFDGTSYIRTSKSFGGTFTILTVSRLAGTSNQRLITSYDRNWVLGFIGGTQDRFHVPTGPSGWVTIASKPANTEPQLYSASSGDGRVNFYANGMDKTEVPQLNNATIGFFQLGAWMEGWEPSTGDVAEVILYNRVLPESERRGVEARLNAKYGLNGVVSANAEVDTSKLGEYTVIYQAADLAGNIATETRKVTVVEDPTIPTITLNGDPFVIHEASTSYTDDGAVLKDAQGNVLDENLLVKEDHVIPSRPGLHTYIYRYEPDGQKAAIPVTRTVEVRDTLPPVVTVTGDAVVKLAVGATYTEEGATATDLATGTVPALSSLEYTFGQLAHFGYKGTANDDSYVDIANGGGLLGMTPVGEAFLTEGPGGRGLDYNSDYDFRDAYSNANPGDKFQNLFHGVFVAPAAGNYLFQLREVDGNNKTSIWIDLDRDGTYENPGDNGNERIAGPFNAEDVEVTLEAKAYPFAIAHRHWAYTGQARVLFSKDGAIPVIINPAAPKQTGYWASVKPLVFDTSQAGTFTVTYTAYDAAGNKGTATRTIVVVDDASIPFIALNEGVETRHEIGTPFVDPGAVVTDANDAVLEGDLKGTGTVDGNTLGEYTLTYEYTDAVTVTRKVIVVDTKKPVPTLVAHANGGMDTVTLTVGTEWVDPGITIDDGDANAWFVSSRYYVPSRLEFSGYEIVTTDRNRLVSFDRDGSLFDYIPKGSGMFTAGPGGTGYDFNNENDFRSVPSGITRNDEFQTLMHGYFRAPVAGTYEFKTDYQRNHQTFWLDVDMDGTFQQSPDRLTWGNGTGTIHLEAGYYRIALGFYHINGQATGHFFIKTPDGLWLSNDFTFVKPGEDNQSTLWYAPGDGPIDTTFPGTHNITYYALDPSGNMATLHRTLIVEIDPDAPVLTLNGEADVAHQLGEAYVDQGVTVTDKDDQVVTDPAPTVEITLDGQIVAEVDGTIAGAYQMVYNFTDSADKKAIPVSRTVVVADTAPPVITLNGDNPVIVSPGIEYFDPGATAVDSLDGEVTVTVKSSSPAMGLLEPGLYSGSFSGSGMNLVLENPGNRGVDPLGPTIAYTKGAPWTGNITFVYTGQIYDADGVMSFSESIDDALYLKVNNEIVLNDGRWNVDVTAAVDFGKGGWFDFELRTYNGGGGAGPVNDPGFGFDPEGGNNFAKPQNVNAGTMSLFRTRVPNQNSVLAYAESTQTITFTATDAAGNTSTLVREILIRDDLTLPVIELEGEAVMKHEVGEPFEDPGYKLLDRRGNVLTGDATITGGVDHTQLGENVIIYEYTDNDGKEAGAIRRYVTVVDTTPPDIILTGGERYRIGIGEEYSEPGVVIEDNLDEGLVAEIQFVREGLSPILYWDFNQTEGTDLPELMNKVNGSLKSFPDPDSAWVEGKYGNALSFDAVTQNYIEIPGTELLDLQEFTISVWVKSSDYNADMFLFEKSSDNNVNSQFNLHFEGDELFYFRTADGQGSFHDATINSTDLLTPDEWQHIAVTFDGTQKIVYINKQLAGIGEHDVTLPTGPNGKSYIGANAPGDGSFFHGILDELKVYDLVIPEDQINTISNRSGVDTTKERLDPPYKFIYTSTDLSGNTSTTERWVIVSDDNTPPTLTLQGAAEVRLKVGETFDDPKAIAIDNEQNVSDQVVITGEVDTSKAGTYILSYDIMDASFNAAPTVTRTVIVEDDTTPTDPLDNWTNTHLSGYSTEQKSPEADPDLDGLQNLLEYALGGNPANPESSASLPKVDEDSGYLTITFFRLKSSVDNKITYTPQLSTSLTTPIWDSTALTVALSTNQENLPSNDFERVTATSKVKMSDEATGQQFIRIQVTRTD